MSAGRKTLSEEAAARRMADVASEAHVSEQNWRAMLSNISTGFSSLDIDSSISAIAANRETDSPSQEQSSSEVSRGESPSLSLNEPTDESGEVRKLQLLNMLAAQSLAKPVAVKVAESKPVILEKHASLLPPGEASFQSALDDNIPEFRAQQQRGVSIGSSAFDRQGSVATVSSVATGGGKEYWEGKAVTEVQLRAEVSRLTQLLTDRKTMFKDLTISDALFQELQLRPERELSLHELACLRAQEYAIPIKRDLESTRKDLQETSVNLGDTQATVETLRLELERHRKLSEAALESEHLEKKAIEERYQRTLRMLEAESALRRQYEDKARKHDEAVDACAKMTVEMNECRATMEQQGKAIDVLQRDETAARESAGESDRARELLALDKTFLQQELRNAESRADEKSRLADTNASKVVSLELKVAQLTDQLMAIKLTAQSDADQRMERELQRLREDYIRELDNMKSAARDVTDRENRVLREARTQLEGEKEHLQRKNDSLTIQLRDKEREASLTLSERTKEIADLRADLKMKIFELSVLSTSFEERMSQLRQLELESETTREELQAHKKAFTQLESESLHRITNLQTQLEEALRRLRCYEDLEQEIDDAVLRVAQASHPSSSHSSSSSSPSTTTPGVIGDRNPRDTQGEQAGQLTQMLQGLPYNPERRLKQCVHLAQRLLNTEHHRDEARKWLVVLEEENASLKRSLDAAREDLSRTVQPKAYIIAKLRDEETARLEYAAKCSRLETELETQTKHLADCEFEIHSLRERLTALLQQRAEIEDLRELLEEWREEEEEEHEAEEEQFGDDGQFGRQSIRGMLATLTNAVQKAGYGDSNSSGGGGGGVGIAEEKFEGLHAGRLPGSAGSASRRPMTRNNTHTHAAEAESGSRATRGGGLFESSPFFPAAQAADRSLLASFVRDKAGGGGGGGGRREEGVAATRAFAALQALSPDARFAQKTTTTATPLQAELPSVQQLGDESFQACDRQRQLEEQIKQAGGSAEEPNNSLLASVDAPAPALLVPLSQQIVDSTDTSTVETKAEAEGEGEGKAGSSSSNNRVIVEQKESILPEQSSATAASQSVPLPVAESVIPIPSAALQSPSSGATIGVSKSPKWHTRELL